MSTDWQYGKLVVICDGCDESLETGQDDFNAGIEYAKKEGWQPRKALRSWTHFCPGCVDEPGSVEP